MPIPLLPILALASLGGGLLYLVSGSGGSKPAPKAPAAETLSFADRGYTVRVTRQKPDSGMWIWSVSRPGDKTKSSTARSRDEAVAAALAWISSRALPPTDDTKPGGDGVVEPPGPVPPIPTPTPNPPAVSEPAPSAWAGGRLRRAGLLLQDRTLTLQNLAQYVASAYGTFSAFEDSPVDIVTKVLQGLLPELAVDDARELELRLVNDKGDRTWVVDAIERVGQLQERLLAPDIDPSLVAYAEDILAEGLFGTEQQLSDPIFAFRGRLIFSRPAAGGYRWSIRDDSGTHGPSEQTFGTRDASNRDAIAAIQAVDEVAA